MTPLAARLAKELTLPAAKRSTSYRGDASKLFNANLHCFEVSAIAEPVRRAAYTMGRDDLHEVMANAFLPSPATWLEMETEYGRTALVLQAHPDSKFMLYFADSKGRGVHWEAICVFQTGIASEEGLQTGAHMVSKDVGELQGRFLLTFAMLLVDAINSRDATALCQRGSHKGVVRAARKHGLDVSSISQWSEVVIPASASSAASGAEPGAPKCLHFVRSHKRRLPGERETIVKAHWRGDADIGAKRTRYKVLPAEKGAPWLR